MTSPFKLSTLAACTLTAVFSFSVAQADQVRPGTVLYKLKSDVTASELKSLNGLLHSHALLEDRVLESLDLHVATFDSVGKELAISKIIMASGAVKFAEPDYEVAMVQTPDDASFSKQWHHQAINATQAWDVTTGDPSVLVGVCDTGVDSDHPDLSANLVLPGYNAADGSTYIEDVHGHGSGTIGTIAAVGNNATGVAGVNWSVGILPVKINISDTNSSAYISTMAECIGWSADQGAKVVNLSYGGIQYSTIDDAATYLRNLGGLLFMSAGNDGLHQDSFPDYNSFVAVGATDQSNVKAGFSNWGEYVDIVAPGVSIQTTYKDAGYVSYSGTSFSSPVVAGVAALMHSIKPGISPSEVENSLFNTALNVGDPLLYGHGLVDAQAAVNSVISIGDNIAPTASFITSGNTGGLPFAVQFDASSSSDPDGEIVSYEWDFGDGQTAIGMLTDHTYTQSGTFSATLTVTDSSGQSVRSVQTMTVLNEEPVAHIVSTVLSGTVPLDVNFDASGSLDSDGQIVSYEWSFGDGATATGINVQHTYLKAGNFTATLNVVDNGGAKASSSVFIEAIDLTSINAPSNLITNVDGQNVVLNWQDLANNEAGFVIERAEKIRGKYQFSEVARVAADVTSFTDLSVSDGTYQYQVYAYNAGLNSALSDAVLVKVETVVNDSITPEPAPGVLVSPTDLVSSINGSDVILSWSDNSADEEGFYIERGLKVRGSVSYQRIATVSANQVSHIDSLTASGTYSYRVQAFKQGEVSGYTNIGTERLR
ncbi:MAG: PKD domain-containing protein [Pseudomonadota bacterium]|nr:PKD domain-containing protein [Pseudomonadota bacterium]